MNVIDLLNFIEASGKVDDAFAWFKYVTVDDRLDKDVMAAQILKECGALVPIYKEIDAFMFNHELWFKANKLVISHLCDTLDYEYSPLENYDWKEIGTKVNNSRKLSDVEGTGKITKDSSYTDTEGISDFNYSSASTSDKLNYGKKTDTSDTETRDLNTHNEHEDENKTSAYNEDLYQPQSTIDGTYTKKDTGTVQNVGDEKLSGSDVSTVEARSGNVGQQNRVLVHDAKENTATTDRVTSSASVGQETANSEKFVLGSTGQYTKQQLIDQERGIAMFNIYEWIARKYAKDNCYRVY